MNTPRFAVLEKFDPRSLQRLREVPGAQVEWLPKQSDLAEVLIIRSKTEVNKELIRRFPSTKWILSTTSGFDHIDFQLTQEKGILVSHTPHSHVNSVVELTFGLLLNTVREIRLREQDVRKGHWRAEERKPGSTLQGRSLGVVGLGRIGTRVAQVAKAFGMHVSACDPYAPLKHWEATGAERCSWEELVRTVDVVTFHVPLTPRTRYLFNADTLDAVPDGLIVINTSRGEVVDESALRQGLQEGRIAAAALDVLEVEPLKLGHPLLGAPNTLITPHIGALTEQALAAAGEEALEQVSHWLAGRPVPDTLPPQAEWYLDSFPTEG